MQNLFGRLHNNNKAITSTLLMDAGIITMGLKKIKLNLEDL